MDYPYAQNLLANRERHEIFFSDFPLEFLYLCIYKINITLINIV